jgi:hypothetical protein
MFLQRLVNQVLLCNATVNKNVTKVFHTNASLRESNDTFREPTKQQFNVRTGCKERTRTNRGNILLEDDCLLECCAA